MNISVWRLPPIIIMAVQTQAFMAGLFISALWLASPNQTHSATAAIEALTPSISAAGGGPSTWTMLWPLTRNSPSAASANGT
ncbi:hypothetical protein D3C85_1499260 [compost metagenome]